MSCSIVTEFTKPTVSCSPKYSSVILRKANALGVNLVSQVTVNRNGWSCFNIWLCPLTKANASLSLVKFVMSKNGL
ncbi:hypothetical protein TUM4249_10030 [Shewanella sp. KT0246]|nr:hypothetical protein TUM4249_10030 [Shewanella sp. KT0246]